MLCRAFAWYIAHMSPVDWRELYASNRAVIERAGVSPAGLRAVTAPRTGVPRLRLPRLRVPHSRAEGSGMDGALVHAPAGLDPDVAVPLVCMLHGCTQDAASFAAATAAGALADRHGFVVLYPEQDRAANPQGCWNWFRPEHQARGAGEPARIAAMVRELVATGSHGTIDPRRVFVAGLSAGGAMAATMAATHPDLFAALAVHSGLAHGAADGMGGAFKAMAGGANGAAIGRLPYPIPTMVVHGDADRTVARVCGEQVLAQWMAANGVTGPPDSTVRGRVPGGHAFTRSRWTDRRGAPVHERLIVEGMGHAWSGGTAGASHTDPRGPDATAAILAFFAEATAAAPAARAPMALLSAGQPK